MVSIASLSDYDEFRLIQEDYCLVGARSGRKFRMGDRVRIKVVAANLDKRQLDYEWILATSTDTDGEEVATKSKPKRKKKKQGEE
jgi:ribonuclease R